jgi:curved DNA-binding protein CbpA
MRNWSKRELLAYLERAHGALERSDPFELLDVSPDDDATTVQRAFHEMAAGLHPDRHRRELTAEQREQLTQVYARIAEAYRVLRDPTERERYLKEVVRRDRKRSDAGAAPARAAQQSTEDALALLSPKAQRLYRRAQASLRTGDAVSASLNLRMALKLHPQSGFLRAALKALPPR